MRSLTWALTWFVVGLAITLGTASVLQQVAAHRTQAVLPAPAADPAPAPVTRPPVIRPPAEGRSLLVAARRFDRDR